MRLQRLTLENFRGFESLDLDLDRSVVVLAGINGSGKSSIVRALGLIGSQLAALLLKQQRREAYFVQDDLREGSAQCRVGIMAGGRRLAAQWDAASDNTNFISDFPDGAYPPLVLALDAGRAQLFPPVVKGSRARATVSTPHPAWDDNYRNDLTTFEWSQAWFREREDVENQRRARGETEYKDQALQRVRAAVHAVLPGYQDLRIDRTRSVGPGTSQLVLTKDGETLPVQVLSDGERGLLVLTMAIARKLALLSDAERAEVGGAVVVIDEIELHLHPKWQREIIPRLRRAFPNCQLILTTHSPQVLASVERESVVVLEGFGAYAATAPTKGRDSNAILEEIMGATQRPHEAEKRLGEVARLIDAGDLDEAKRRLMELAGDWGDDDREVIRLRTAIDFRGLDAVDQ